MCYQVAYIDPVQFSLDRKKVHTSNCVCMNTAKYNGIAYSPRKQ